MKLTAKETKLLEWLERTGELLETQVVGSGLSKALDGLLANNLADLTAHSTVKDKDGMPATAVVPKKKESA